MGSVIKFSRTFVILNVIVLCFHSLCFVKGHATSITSYSNRVPFGLGADESFSARAVFLDNKMDIRTTFQKLEIPVTKDHVILDMFDKYKVPVIFYASKHDNKITVEAKSLYNQPETQTLLQYGVTSLPTHDHVKLHIGEEDRFKYCNIILLTCVITMMLIIAVLLLKTGYINLIFNGLSKFLARTYKSYPTQSRTYKYILTQEIAEKRGNISTSQKKITKNKKNLEFLKADRNGSYILLSEEEKIMEAGITNNRMVQKQEDGIQGERTTQVNFRHSTHAYYKYHRYLFIALFVTFLLGIVCATLTYKSPDVQIHIGLPRNLIRKVRMYSDDPDIKRLHLNKTILSLISRLQLYDKSGCNDDISKCETYAICNDDVSNSVTCRCKRGYYYKQQTCSECSKSCPRGHYMTSPCTTTRDVVCKKCTPCHGSQYEAAVCTTTKDTVCVDVSFPVGFVPVNSTNTYDGSNMSMSSSTNVFLERLKDMKELETTMYITNNQQSLDFVWKRESGLEIKISVSGVYLVPEYVDLDHEDDGLYFLHFDKNVSEEMKNKYSHVKEFYCRHPIPDYYSLHFDIIKNRMTKAEEVRCNSKDPKIMKCPKNYHDGQVYLKRHINDVCRKFQPNRKKKLIELHDINANNVICDEENELLTEVFGQTMSEPDKMRFPSAECRQYFSGCHKCLDKNICNTNNTYGEGCCGLSCYSNSDCLQYYRSTCPTPQVECAKGSINQFTITPIFEKISERFMCHLKYKKPSYLYNVSYAIQIPGFKYVLPEQNFTFTSDSLASHETQHHKIDFLNILHDTRYKLEDEVIVIGRHEDYNEQMGEFQFSPLKSQEEFNTARGFKVKQDTFYRYSSLVQFYRPFSYSSSTWFKDGCLKNLSKVFPNQTQYKSVSVPVTAKVLNTKTEMQYQMYKSQNSPIVKLTIDEAESILSFFQSNVRPTVVKRSSLNGRVTWNDVTRLWSLRLSGSLADCPGILIIELFDKLLIHSLGVFDVFVYCGGEFWVEFKFGSYKSNLPDVFVVHVNDSVTTHKLILSSVVAPRSIPVADKMSASLAVREKMATYSPPWISILVVLALSVIALWVMLVFYMCYTIRAPYNYERTDQKEMTLLNPEETEKMYEAEMKPKRKKVSLCVVYLFVIMYLTYCIFLTFSVSFGILYAYQKSMLPDLSQLNDFSDRLEKRVNHTLQNIKLTEIEELATIQKQFKSRERACKHHIHQKTRSSLHSYAQLTHKYLEAIYIQNGSLQHYVSRHFEIEKTKMGNIIDEYVELLNRTVKQDLTHFLSMYKYFLVSVVNNKWLDFPREIFGGDVEKLKSGDKMSKNQIKKFVAWLQIDKAESLISVDNTVSKRLSSFSPSSADYQPSDYLENYLPGNLPKIPTSHFKSQNYMYQVINKNSSHRHKVDGIHFDSTRHNSSEDIGLEGSDYNHIMYLFIAMFIIMDVLLWFYRISWLYKQIKLSKVGYEVKIPTDESSRKIHILLTGHHSPSTVDIEIENAFKYYKENAAKDLASDNEYGMSFIQNYPKCKEDILRDIWAYKKSQSSGSVTKGNDFCMNECMTIIYWIHRAVLSRLTWRSALSCGAIVLVCCLIYAVDNWLNQANIEVLVGADVVVTELKWQTIMINQQLANTVDKLNVILLNMKETMDTDVSYVNQVLADTFHKQTRHISAMLLSICKNSGLTGCSIDISSLLFQPPSPITTCNFLPLQHHVIDDVDTAQITALVIEELSPLLKTVRGLVFCILTYLVFVMCFILLCNAGVRLARYYLLIMGKFPILQIYQISDSLATYADAAAEEAPHIYRSASLSCESGVYVGETEESARE